MLVREAMTREVRVCSPSHSISDCARLMAGIDAGILPVAEENHLVGMLTDRDIAVRAVAAGKGSETPAREVMSRQVLYCFDDQDLDHIAKSMGEARVRRLPVVDRQHRLVGIISLADVAQKHTPEAAGSTISAVSRRGGPHCQATSGPAGAGAAAASS